ncbi:MAG: ADOP family duplicated permease [Vicinamibacterales bacterium]
MRPSPGHPDRVVAVPRVPAWLVARLVREPHREFLLGDLEEQFTRAAAQDGPARARHRYWRQAVRCIGAARSLRPVPSGGRPSPARRLDMSRVFDDIRTGLRSIRRSPGYSAVSILTLALAIGANTLLFSIANPLVVRPLPLKDSGTLGWILMAHPERQVTRGRVSVPDFMEWRASLHSFSALAGYGVRQATLLGHGDATRVVVAHATADLPEVWGLTPIVGRAFQPGEDAPGQPAVGLLSHRYWQAAFQGDPAVAGQTYFLDGRPVTVVGVMPASIELGTLSLIDVWVPLTLDASAPRDDRWVLPTGRLAPGATVASADAEFQTLFAAQQRDHPDLLDGWTARVTTTQAAIAAENTWVILTLLGIVVTFVLLIACANLANLVMARLVARRQELDVRVALGATRWEVVRPWLVEGLLLSVCGGAGGVAIAYGGLRVINAVAFEPFLRALAIDGYVLAFAAGISVATPLLFALWPAVSAGRAVTSAALHGARIGGTRGAAIRRNLLVGAQVALALALLVVSGLAVQSMLFIRNSNLGYDPSPLLTWGVSLPADRYADDAARARYVADTVRALSALPDVRGAALASALPVFDADAPRPISGTRHDGDTEAERPWASWFAVSSGFFDTIGIPLLTGRTFTEADRAGGLPVAVLGRLAAERYFDDVGSAIGARIVIHDSALGAREATVIGVVGDTRDNQLLHTSPQVYVPLAQWPVPALAGIVRADDPSSAATGVRTTLRRLDDAVAVSNLQPMTQTISQALSSNAILNGLFLSFAGLALVLATAGLFGVISYSVGQRRREIGIRLALGASPRMVGRMVVSEGLRVTLAGVAAGLVIAMALASLSASVLFGVSPRDPLTFGGVTAIVIIVALAASWSPALRAMRVDPARALRAE